VAAVDVLRTTLFGASGVDERGGLARGNRRFHLRPRHHLELDQRRFLRGGFRGRRFRGWRLRERDAGGQQDDRKRRV
jgi:hypothetical protein